MSPFAFTSVKDAATAIRVVTAQPTARYLAGGTNLVDLMKEGVERPEHLVSIHKLPLEQIKEHEGGVRIGALARNADTARDPIMRQAFPLIVQAILSGASPQLRNAATNGGNLLQRTRCHYFYDTTTPCNKRAPGTGCGALDGYNRIHAILGASEHCVATHPSDMCVALAALEAMIQVEGPNGARSIPIADFHRLPGTTPDRDTNLAHGELITAIDLPAGPYAAHAHYLKLRDRASYAFALVSVAAALELDGKTIRSARLALGGVAHKPWRALEAETALIGMEVGESAFGKSAEIALRDAKALKYNGFKVDLAKHAIVGALAHAAAGTQQMDFYTGGIE